MIQNPVVSAGGVCPWKEIGTASEFDSRVQDGEYGATLFLVDGYQSFIVLNESGSEVYAALKFDPLSLQFAPGWSARYFIFEG